MKRLILLIFVLSRRPLLLSRIRQLRLNAENIQNYDEIMCFDICETHLLLAPIYKNVFGEEKTGHYVKVLRDSPNIKHIKSIGRHVQLEALISA